MKSKLCLLVFAVFLLLARAGPSEALPFSLSFTGSSPQSSGYGTVDTIDNLNGSFAAISGTVTMMDGAIFTLFPQYTLTGTLTSPAGLFIYDNLIFSLSPHLDNGGLLFTKAGGVELNIWGNAPGQPFSVYIGQNGGYPVSDNNVSFESTPTPEPGSILLLAIGLASLGLFVFRRSSSRHQE